MSAQHSINTLGQFFSKIKTENDKRDAILGTFEKAVKAGMAPAAAKAALKEIDGGKYSDALVVQQSEPVKEEPAALPVEASVETEPVRQPVNFVLVTTPIDLVTPTPIDVKIVEEGKVEVVDDVDVEYVVNNGVKKEAKETWLAWAGKHYVVVAVIIVLLVLSKMIIDGLYRLSYNDVFFVTLQGICCLFLCVCLMLKIDTMKEGSKPKMLMAWGLFVVFGVALSLLVYAAYKCWTSTKPWPPVPEQVVSAPVQQSQQSAPPRSEQASPIQTEPWQQALQDQGQSGGYTPYVPNPPLVQQPPQPRVESVVISPVSKPWPTISGMVCQDKDLLFAIGHLQSNIGKVCYKIKAYEDAVAQEKKDKEKNPNLPSRPKNGNLHEYWAIVDWVADQKNVPDWKVIRGKQRQILALWNCDIVDDQQVVCSYPNPETTNEVQGYVNQAIKDLSSRN